MEEAKPSKSGKQRMRQTVAERFSSMAKPPFSLLEPPPGKKIIDTKTYKRIVDLIWAYNGLALDNELERLQDHFMDIWPLTLKSIVFLTLSGCGNPYYCNFEQSGRKYFKRFKKLAYNSGDDTLLLQLASHKRIGPLVLCNLILSEIYQNPGPLFADPSLIHDVQLSANVRKCLAMDTTDSLFCELHCDPLHEKFKVKLKWLADALNLMYYVGNDFDEPDFQMIVPFMYKGRYVYWMMSVAEFGDLESYKLLLHRLYMFKTRLGPGLVIYWLGYHEDILSFDNISEYGVSILTDFPQLHDLNCLT